MIFIRPFLAGNVSEAWSEKLAKETLAIRRFGYLKRDSGVKFQDHELLLPQHSGYRDSNELNKLPLVKNCTYI